MRAVSSVALAPSIESDRPSGRGTDQMVGNVLADIARTLWPKNTAPNLAAEIDCEVRSVERYLEGSRDWSGDAVAAIVAEILHRHSVRNLRVTARK